MIKIVVNTVIILLLINSNMLLAQLGFSIENESGYTSNAFANHRSLPDFYTNMVGYLNYDWINQRQGIRWFYKGSLDAFEQYQNRTFHNHSTGVSYYRNWGEDGNRLNAGLDISKRFYGEDYSWFEFQQYYAYVNSKYIFSEQIYGYLGANIRWRNYTLLNVFSHWQNVIFWRLSRFYNTGTTIILEADLMSKKYYPSGPTSNIEGLPEIITVGDGTSQQIVGIIKAAQALTPKTGVSFQLLLRKNLVSSIRYLGTTTGYYYSDEELFDDVYGYNGEEFSIAIKHQFPLEINGSVGNYITLKHYNNRLALDLEGVPFPDNQFRADKRWIGWIKLEKAIRLSKRLQPIIITVNYTFTKNSSNDPYYDYHRDYLSFGLSQNF